MLKLVLFAYTRSVFSSRRIQLLAVENKSAEWLVQSQTPSYRTICRFRISDDLETLIDQSLDELTKYLRAKQLIGTATFIDGTKILADANKYSFVWKKNTIRYDKMNRTAILELLEELKTAQINCEIPDGSQLNFEMLDEVILRIEERLKVLNQQIDADPKRSPNPDKQQRRTLKSKRNKLTKKQRKLLEHQQQFETYGDRNSYSKTDYEATFMRIKEDPMKNGQLKPGYNVQIATNNQFVVGYALYQRPTDTRTLIPFLKRLDCQHVLEHYIVADAGYGSEQNYQYIEDKLPDHIPLIPYGTMLKENSRKWQSDDRKVMNWTYHEDDDYYVDPHGVRFNFKAYRKRTDKQGFVRDFKEYDAELVDENQQPVAGARTPKGYQKKISVNPSWEYYKAQERKRLSAPETAAIYGQRKIDVEPVFGRMKAYLHFHRFSVRGLNKVQKETGILLMALNIVKLVARDHPGSPNSLQKTKKIPKRKLKSIFTLVFFILRDTYVTAPCICSLPAAV